MKCFALLTVLAFASKNGNNAESAAAAAVTSGENVSEENPIVVKIEEEEYAKRKGKSSKYIGVYYHERSKKWNSQRTSKIQKKHCTNGYYSNEETAARASDTLARKLMKNGKQNLKLNFPEESTDVYPEEKTKSSRYFGIYYIDRIKRWYVQRWIKSKKKYSSNGYYKDEETAARASDTLARKFIASGEEHHKLNFPGDNTEVYPEKATTTSKYFGVSYNARFKKWDVQRWSKNEKKNFHNGYYRDEETAAHASDSLARTLLANGEDGHKLNFPDDNTEVYPGQREKKVSEYVGVFYNEKHKTWSAIRWSRSEKKNFANGTYKDEEKTARASDNLARELLATGEKGHKLNFPDERTQAHLEKQQKNKRKRSSDSESSQENENDL